MPKKLLFDHETCTRCCGTGSFSYCQSYGTTCFKCHGNGVTLTKKGAAANAWFHAKKKKVAAEVKVGEWMVVEGCPGFSKNEVVKVTFAGFKETGNKYMGKDGEWKDYFIVEGVNAKGETHGVHTFENAEVTMAFGKAETLALKLEAKAFEATLTKAGTVAKKAAKKEAAAMVA